MSTIEAISTERALKLALEALNTTESDCGSRAWEREQEAITALREALNASLAEPTSADYAMGYAEGFNDACKPSQQEPVAWRWSESGGVRWFDWTTDWSHYDRAKAMGFPIQYAAPQPAPVQQEPVATLWQHGETGRTRITMPGDITDCDARWFKAADLYTSPPAQRKPLTDEQQIAEALRVQGLTLVKTASGYEVLKLGQITAHGIKE